MPSQSFPKSAMARRFLPVQKQKLVCSYEHQSCWNTACLLGASRVIRASVEGARPLTKGTASRTAVLANTRLDSTRSAVLRQLPNAVWRGLRADRTQRPVQLT